MMWSKPDDHPAKVLPVSRVHHPAELVVLLRRLIRFHPVAFLGHDAPLARTADGPGQLVGQQPAVSGADGSLGGAVLATGYGAAGVSTWNQRDRSLVPWSLMALIR